MKAFLRRVVDQFRDSPTTGRDRASLLSGFSIGITGLLLNGVVMILVVPLMLDPDDRDIRIILENIEFGQLLALILLGGATALATILIPLRMATVFMGPRTGRYFDQIVLSGISPLRFVIGKVSSQNLFLGLCLFLMIPHLVLSLTLGGVDPETFLACLFLIWLYCLALSLVTLWVALYVNEVLGALFVMWCSAWLMGLGCVPIPSNPFVVTPMPALIQPLYHSIPFPGGTQTPQHFLPIFVSCVLGISSIAAVALFGLYLGPLYGIIRENSTFGEVVRKGDSKRKRWMRMRLHIQRPSELAFFYQNRGLRLRSCEGLVRWGLGLTGLLMMLAVAHLLFSAVFAEVVNRGGGPWLAPEYHSVNMAAFAISLVLGACIFSHPLNTTLLRVGVFGGKTASVAQLDTFCFFLFAAASALATDAAPYLFDYFVCGQNGPSVMAGAQVHSGTFIPVELLGQLTPILFLAGLTLYCFHRFACLSTWMRAAAIFSTCGVYWMVVCMGPLFVSMLVTEFSNVPLFAPFTQWAPDIAVISPFTCALVLFGEFGRQVTPTTPLTPFYVVHGGLLAVGLCLIWRRTQVVRAMYPKDSPQEVA